MKQIWILAKRELKSFFDSLGAYLLLVFFLSATGFFTWIYAGSNVFVIKAATLQAFFATAYWSLFAFIPALTMKMIAEERKTGTIELLLTKAVNDWQIVVGKFLGTFLLICVALALTLPYYFSIASIGPIDHGAVWTGYLGLLFMSAAYISIGIFASSVTNNQIIAFLLSLFIGIFFHLIFRLLGSSVSGVAGDIFHYLNLNTHYEAITRGVIDTKDIIYFFSIIVLGLVGAESALSKRLMN